MIFITNYTTPFKQFLAWLCSFLPFSLTELLYFLAISWIIIFIIRTISKTRHSPHGKSTFLRQLLFLVTTGLTVYLLLCILYGANYYTPDVASKMDITTTPISVEQLSILTAYFAKQANIAATSTTRDQNLIFVANQQKILAASADIYTNIEKIYPFLQGRHISAKPMLFSRLMSHLSYTGFFFPFTGEANINVHAPGCLLPATITHELAHQRGIASEDEANFIAILAATTSDDMDYIYSGYLLGSIYLGNALQTVAPDAYRKIAACLSPAVRADLRYHNHYWRQYQGVIADTGLNIYDRYLKSYGQESGIASYSQVIDLLVAYYTQIIVN
ncbi:MAG: DUF3810 domain-containing protein [Clostridiales bacterium]